MDPGPGETIFRFGVFDKTEPSRLNALERKKWAHRLPPDEIRDMTELLVIWTQFSRGLARTRDARMLYAMEAKGGGRSSAIIRKIWANRSRGMATSAIWKTT
jgi:hypothetical protein